MHPRLQLALSARRARHPGEQLRERLRARGGKVHTAAQLPSNAAREAAHTLRWSAALGPARADQDVRAPQG